VGSIGLYLEDRMNDMVTVLGIESNKAAVLDANRNAVINGVINARYICGAAEDVLPGIVDKMREQGLNEYEEGSIERFAGSVLASANVAVLDPPRAGCDEKLLAAVVKVSPERIVYVSCDPATLARDVKYLKASGYTFIKAAPVDMFPHTGHIETIVLLTKAQ
jgi:23S rRNA (uracil1939-C5)-methyltransferase